MAFFKWLQARPVLDWILMNVVMNVAYYFLSRYLDPEGHLTSYLFFAIVYGILSAATTYSRYKRYKRRRASAASEDAASEADPSVTPGRRG